MSRELSVPRLGKLIAISGGVRTGKSTQIKRLLALFRGLFDPQSIIFNSVERFGFEAKGRFIQEILAETRFCNYDALSLFLRGCSLMHEEGRIFIERGMWVISEGDAVDACAYYGRGLGLKLDYVSRLYEEAPWYKYSPDIIVLLDMDFQEALERPAVDDSPQLFQRTDPDFHCRVRVGFLEQLEANPDSIVRIDASQPEEKVTRDILDLFYQKFPELSSFESLS